MTRQSHGLRMHPRSNSPRPHAECGGVRSYLSSARPCVSAPETDDITGGKKRSSPSPAGFVICLVLCLTLGPVRLSCARVGIAKGDVVSLGALGHGRLEKGS